MMHWGNYGGMGFGWIFMILFWALVILVIFFLIKYIAGRDRTESPKETALDILKKRYAKGEINKEEFEDKKKDLL
jgi:putative membrane protein